jgi:NAD(P)-dependent dehydrogenase (short-subunit alcohol dehydrogenase family)
VGQAGQVPSDRPVAVVTGATRGIGREVARQLLDLGYAVALGARDPTRGHAVAEQLGSPDVVAVPLDVTADPGPALDAVSAAFGRADVLVNNAAIHWDPGDRAVSVPIDVVREALETNLLGAWRTTQAFLPLLRRAAHPRIVNVSSEAGSLASIGGAPAYSVSKAALNALTLLLAGELPAFRVNAVCPGWVATDMGGPGGSAVSTGAAGVVWAAVLPDDGPTGGFFRDGRPVPW